MQSPRATVQHSARRRVPVLLLSLVLGGALTARPGAQTKKGTVEHIKVHGAALEGNLEGDSPDRDVFIYLPPSYAATRNQRYPVVYLLHGYGLTAERWMTFANLAETSDKDIAAGTMRELILVSPDAYTVHGGSMYSSSPTTGDWETYIAEDLVSYVDSHYRTMASRASRGLGGHSMGGYGTIRIGMKRPDVFSNLYVMSACCLMNNQGGGGRGNRGPAPQGANPATAPGPGAVASSAAPSAVPADSARGEAGRAGAPGQEGNRGRGGRGNVQFALAAAWAPNSKNPPQFFDLPTQDGPRGSLAAAKMAANSPLAMLDQYVTSLKKYRSIMVDVGLQDGLAASNQQMDQALTDLGVPHIFETYEGDHTSRVKERFEVRVLPFFSNNLAFSAAKK